MAPRGESPRVGTGPSPGRSSHTGSAGWGHLGFLPAFQRKQSSCAPSAAAGPFPRRACRLVGQAHPQLTADIPTTNSRQVLHKSLSTLPQGATLCLAGTETPFIPQKQTDPCSGRDRNSVLSPKSLTEEENYSRIRFRIPPAPSLETLKEVVWGLPVPAVSSCLSLHSLALPSIQILSVPNSFIILQLTILKLFPSQYLSKSFISPAKLSAATVSGGNEFCRLTGTASTLFHPGWRCWG